MDPSDPDDWFADAELEDDRRPAGGPADAAAPAEDDWLGEVEARVVSRRPSWAEAIDRRVLAVGASLLAVLIAGLAAGGVFSGGGSKQAGSTSTAPTTTTQATTTATTTVQRPPAPTTTLKPGDTGTQVTTLQRALASLGFSAGKADGRYGPATTAAVTRFQRHAGLTADGIVGPATLRALVNALRGP